jgi:hypothetical protein
MCIHPLPLVTQAEKHRDSHHRDGDSKRGIDARHVRDQDARDLLGREDSSQLRRARCNERDGTDIWCARAQLDENLVYEGGLSCGNGECATDGLEDCVELSADFVC